MNLSMLKNGLSSLSGSPVEMQWFILPYNDYVRKQAVYVVITISAQATANADLWIEIKNTKVFPGNDGGILLDISSIIHPYLQYFVPPLNLDQQIKATGQYRQFRVKASLIVNNELEHDLTIDVWAIKGGAGYEFYSPEHFSIWISNSWYASKKALLFADGKDKVFIDDVFFLYYLAKQITAPFTGAYFEVNYLKTNGEYETTSYPIDGDLETNETINVNLIPAGYDQLNIQDAIPDGAIPVWYSIYVMAYDGESGDAIEIVAPVKFYIDHRKFYNTHQILYRNSLGGLQPLRLTGQVDFEAEYELQGGRTISPPSWIKDKNIVGNQVQDFNEEQPKFIGNTGFLSKFAAERMRDFFLSPERFVIKDGRLLPIVINNKNVKFYANRDNMISLQVEYQHAFTNNYFTTRLLAADICPALHDFRWQQSGDDEITVYWWFPFGYDYGRVLVTFDGEDPQEFTLEGNSGSKTLLLLRPEWATEETYLLVTANVICNRYLKDPSYGPEWNEGTVPLQPFIPIVAVDDFYTIPKGYTTAVTLSGSALDNDYDPNGEPIEAIVDSGATTQGGSYAIDADGIIQYTPPSASFTGDDTFTYEARKVGGSVLSTATVTITVEDVETFTYAKIIYRNIVHSGNNVKGEAWVDFFSDPLCVYPKSVSGLTVNWRKTETIQPGGTTVTDDSVVVNGTRVMVYKGWFHFEAHYFLLPDIIKDWVISLLPGNGYIAL